MTDEELASGARRVLRTNDTGRWTAPSRARYPHQGTWDSAFVAIGLSTFDWERAAAEVEAVLEARWREGLLPHVRYDLRRAASAVPGPERWPLAQAHVADSAVRTSGIGCPPLLVTAALLVGRRQPDPGRRVAFWRRTYRRLRGTLDYLATRRRVPGSPLVAVVHPSESGWDDSPRWDHLRRAGESGGERALAEVLDSVDYDLDAYREVSPFLVHDVLFDALWYRAARDLDEIARELGEPEPAGPARLEEFAAAFEERHWDAGMGLYVDWDCVAGRRLVKRTAAGLAALAGGLISPARARSTWRRYHARAAGARSVCTVPPGDVAFDAGRPWRGPVWAPVNWLVASGLDGAGLAAEAAALREETLDLVREAGFAERFDPMTGAAAGAGDSSSTAAVTLDLLTKIQLA